MGNLMTQEENCNKNKAFQELEEDEERYNEALQNKKKSEERQKENEKNKMLLKWVENKKN